jgi:A/G-specific adenine glycosylase
LLQQTRVSQAVPYYERFIVRFPHVRALARAREETVLRIWQGAGYYARARHLHAAARVLVRDYHGQLPSSLDRLEELPGFGSYIARAVASLAFDVPVVALEANGRRVAARWWADRGNVRAAVTQRRFERRLAAILPPKSPGTFNEAIMELGETVCLPRTPRCTACPVREHCRAYATLSDPGAIPLSPPPRRRRHVRAAVVVLEVRGRFLVQRRPSTGLLGGLYEFPGGKIERGETPVQAARREAWEETGLRLGRLEARGVVRHAYSHFTVELHVFRARLTRRPSALQATSRWASPRELRRLPLPKATEKVVELVRKGPSRAIRPVPTSSRVEKHH